MSKPTEISMKIALKYFDRMRFFFAKKANPNVVMIILVIMFFILLYAAENIVKLTLLQ